MSAEIVPFPDYPTAPCDTEMEAKREALEAHMDPTFIDYGCDIRIPVGRLSGREVSPETRARMIRHHCRTAGTTGMLNAFAEIPAPRSHWLRVAGQAVGFLFMVGVATVLAIGMMN